MTKIYEQAKDVHVKSSVIYAKDNMAYKDVTCSIPYTTSELKEAFLKGAVIDIPAGYYNNIERLMLVPSSMSLSKDGLACLNFDIPWYGRNQYRCYITEDLDVATLIGSPKTKKRIREEPNDNMYELILNRTNASGDMFGIEFGPGTEMHAAISRLLSSSLLEFPSAHVVMSVYFSGVPMSGSEPTITLTCNGVSITETITDSSLQVDLSLSPFSSGTGENTLRIELNGVMFGDVAIYGVQVYSYTYDKEKAYKTPEDRMRFISSIPDPT